LGLLGNRDLSRSVAALHRADYAAAATAVDHARRWEPWSSAPWAQLALIRHLQGDTERERLAWEQAVAKDPRDWELWVGLASVSHGREYRRALRRLSVLSPAAAAGVKGHP
jgi:hypothetical protein